MYIYISPICNVVVCFSVNIIKKLGILPFLSSPSIRARRENLYIYIYIYLYFFFSVIVFPSGHFILLPEPFAVGSPRRRRRRCRQISLPLETFFGQLFSGRKPQIPRRTRPIYTRRRKPRRKTALHALPRATILRRHAFHSPARVAHFPVTRFHL